jgi:hypothetical protein
MPDLHIFQGGEGCDICAALDGTEVAPGFTAHVNCSCSTVPKDDEECEHEVGPIEWEAEDGHVVGGFEVTVTCPGGATAGASGSISANANAGDNPVSMLWEAVSELAHDLCESCPEETEEEPFNCC